MKEGFDNGRFTDPNEIARRFGSKPGFQLIDFIQVAIPVFIVPIDALVIAAKPLQLVDEFLLRSIAEGVNTLDSISGFLGLETAFVKKRLGHLISQDLVAYGPSPDSFPKAVLTGKGVTVLKQAVVIQPKRESFQLAIDGVTRQPLATRPHRLFAVREIRAFGLLEIPAFPQDKAPEFDEVARMDLTGALAAGTKREKAIQRIMSLMHMGRRQRRYREATMLVFRAERGKQIHVEFFVDGRPAQSTTEAFARHKGVSVLHIAEQVEASVHRTQQEIESVLPGLIGSKEFAQATTIRPKVLPFVNRVGNLESKIEEKQISIEEANSRSEVERLKAELTKLSEEKRNAEAELNNLETRVLEVHEHRPLFERCLEQAKYRLLIISPWIRDSVLTRPRLDKLKRLIDSGVEVLIGYGLGEDGKPGRDKGENAIKFLEGIAEANGNLRFEELGDTHAKILLMDDVCAVVGSFNWLSFEGSSKRDFREELSLRINRKNAIDELFERYVARFDGIR